MENNIYYNVPTQVAFWDDDHYVGGIAYRDEIICGCCGGVVEIDELYEFAPSGINPVIPYDYWVDIEDEIIDDKEREFTYEEENCEEKEELEWL